MQHEHQHRDHYRCSRGEQQEAGNHRHVTRNEDMIKGMRVAGKSCDGKKCESKTQDVRPRLPLQRQASEREMLSSPLVPRLIIRHRFLSLSFSLSLRLMSRQLLLQEGRGSRGCERTRERSRAAVLLPNWSRHPCLWKVGEAIRSAGASADLKGAKTRAGDALLIIMFTNCSSWEEEMRR